MAMEGGGFRAQSVDSGFFAGMLAFAGMQQNRSSPTLESTGLLDRFFAFSTISGSSWFFSNLAYSSGFKSLLEQMAASPIGSKQLYRAGYTEKWLNATNVNGTRFNWFEDAARAISDYFDDHFSEDSIYILTCASKASEPHHVSNAGAS
jgi:hypothetical protein